MLNQLNLKTLFILVSFYLFLASCEKSPITSADFKVQSNSVYLYEEVTFEAIDSITGLNYYWDFGDGTIFRGGYKTTHEFKKPGIHKVKLEIAGFTYSKDVVVYSGSISYQIKNESSHNIALTTFVDNPNDFGFANLTIDSGSVSDTIFSKSLDIGGGLDMLGIHTFVNNVEYLIYSPNWIKSLQHNVFLLNDSTVFSKRFSNAIGPNSIRLGEMK